MRTHRLVLGVAVLSLAAGSFTAADDDDDRGERHFSAILRSFNEVPAISSPEAHARFRATLNEDATQLDFELKFEGLSANAAAAHIHLAQKDVNGGVMAFLCGGGGQPACPAATSGTVTGTITAANIIGPTGQGVPAGAFDEFVGALRRDVAYANIHNATFPGGEIRGQIR